MFCPKCGSILLPKVEKGKAIISCSCGYKNKEGTEKVEIKESTSIKKTERTYEVIEEKENLPLTYVDCPKCKHTKAYYWTKQTRAADEPETRFFKCEKCKHTWREYR